MNIQLSTQDEVRTAYQQIEHRVSEASVIQSCHQLSEQIIPSTQAVKAQLQQAKVVHYFDYAQHKFGESGMRVTCAELVEVKVNSIGFTVPQQNA